LWCCQRLIILALGAATFDHLRMFATNDIWIEGAMHNSATNVDTGDVPINYHFDGAAWSNLNLQAPGNAQHVGIVSSNVAWSYVNVQPTLIQEMEGLGEIASIYSNASGQWKSLAVPHKDLMTIEFVSSSGTDVWAIEQYMVTTQVPESSGSDGKSYASIGHHVLLHYVGGVWTEYGR
jgi:hypothetical protein